VLALDNLNEEGLPSDEKEAEMVFRDGQWVERD
jgi:hypothetical protein